MNSTCDGANFPFFSRTFSKLEFVENGSFTSGIKTHHQDSHLFLAELLRQREHMVRKSICREKDDQLLRDSLRNGRRGTPWIRPE
jgi:hypothetical protein